MGLKIKRLSMISTYLYRGSILHGIHYWIIVSNVLSFNPFRKLGTTVKIVRMLINLSFLQR